MHWEADLGSKMHLCLRKTDQALCVASLVYDDAAKLLELAPSKVAFDLDAGKDDLLDVTVGGQA